MVGTGRDPEVVAYVKEHTTPKERIWCWASRPEIYYYSGRLPASPFVAPFSLRFTQAVPLVQPTFPLADRWSNETKEMMRDRPPKLIITEFEPPEKAGGQTKIAMFPPTADRYWLDVKVMLRNVSPMPKIPPPGAETSRPAIFTLLEQMLNSTTIKLRRSLRSRFTSDFPD